MRKAGLQCDVRDGLESIEGELVRRSAQPSQLDISVRSNSNIVRKLVMEMELREVRDTTQTLDRQRLVQVPLDEIEDSTESLRVGSLGVSLHASRPGHKVAESRARTPDRDC